jgi:hypothetical protein
MNDDPHTIIVDDPIGYCGYLTFLMNRGRLGPGWVSITSTNDDEIIACGRTEGDCFNPWCASCELRRKHDLDELHQYRSNGKTNGGRKTKRIRGLQ